MRRVSSRRRAGTSRDDPVKGRAERRVSPITGRVTWRWRIFVGKREARNGVKPAHHLPFRHLHPMPGKKATEQAFRCAVTVASRAILLSPPL